MVKPSRLKKYTRQVNEPSHQYIPTRKQHWAYTLNKQYVYV
jgi:hypothetical protein